MRLLKKKAFVLATCVALSMLALAVEPAEARCGRADRCGRAGSRMGAILRLPARLIRAPFAPGHGHRAAGGACGGCG